MGHAMLRLDLTALFADSPRADGLSALRMTRKEPREARAPLAHVTVHGDLFCVGCKTPERYDDGHQWLPVYETGRRVDACDECGNVIGGVS